MDFDDDTTTIAPVTTAVVAAVPEKKIVPFEATTKALDAERGIGVPVEAAARQKAFESFIWSTQQKMAPAPGDPKTFSTLAALGWPAESVHGDITLKTQDADHLATHPIKHTITARLTASDMLRILSCPLFYARSVQQDWPIMLSTAAFIFPGQVAVSSNTQAAIDETAADTTWGSTFTSADLATAAVVASRDIASTQQAEYFVKMRKVIVSGDRLVKHYETLGKEAASLKATLPAGVSDDLVKRFANLTTRVTAAAQSIDASLTPSACAFVLYECAMYNVPDVPKTPTPFDEMFKGPAAAPFRAHVIKQNNRYPLTITAECKGKDAGSLAKIVINMYLPFTSTGIFASLKAAVEKAAGATTSAPPPPTAAAAAVTPAPTTQTIASATPATTAAVVASKSEFAVRQQELATTPVKLPEGIAASQKSKKVTKDEPAATAAATATPAAATAEKRKREGEEGDEQQKKKGVAAQKDPDADVNDKVPPPPTPVATVAAVAVAPPKAPTPPATAPALTALELAAVETLYAVGTDAYKASCIDLTTKAATFAQSMLDSKHPYARRYNYTVQTLHKPPTDAAMAQARSDVGKMFAAINYLGVLPEFIAALKAKHIDLPPPPPPPTNEEPPLF